MKKTQIVSRLKQRLSDWYVLEFDGRGPHVYLGYPEVEVTIFPSVWIFEDVEEAEFRLVHRAGLYDLRFRLTVEFFFRPNRVQASYDEARSYLYKLRGAIEQDRDFGGLVYMYHMTRNETQLFRQDVVDVIVQYQFQYTEPFGSAA